MDQFEEDSVARDDLAARVRCAGRGASVVGKPPRLGEGWRRGLGPRRPDKEGQGEHDDDEQCQAGQDLPGGGYPPLADWGRAGHLVNGGCGTRFSRPCRPCPKLPAP